MIKNKQTYRYIPVFLALSSSLMLAENDIQQTSRFLQQAQQSRAENLRTARAEAGNVNAALAEKLLEQAKATDGELPNNPTANAAGEKLKQVMSTASPEAKILIAQSNNAAASTAPPASRVVPKEEVSITDVANAKPKPLRPTSLEPEDKKAAKNVTVITASGAAFFDSKESIGVFTEDVVVKDPRFNITCDVLEVFMKKQKPEGAAAPANAAADAGTMQDADIDRAIAKGRKVVIQKLNEEGKLQIGICRHATYEASTGDIILRDFPQVQSESRSATATDRSTVITLKNNGQFEVKGPHTTVLGKSQDNKSTAPGAPAGN